MLVLCTILKAHKNLNWAQFGEGSREKIIFMGTGGAVGGGVWCRPIGT
jgi:hypothetical protein